MGAPKFTYTRHTLKIFGMLTALGVITLCLYIFIMHSWGNIQGFVSRLWNLVFGIMMLMGEIEADFVKGVLTHLSFLTTDFGRGVFFIFVGTQVLADNWWEILIACFSGVCGLLHIVFAMTCQDAQEPEAASAAPGKTEAVRNVPVGDNPFAGGAAGAAAGGDYRSRSALPAASANDNPFSRPRDEYAV